MAKKAELRSTTRKPVRLFVLLSLAGRYTRDVLRGVASYESDRYKFLVEFGDMSGHDYIVSQGFGPIITMYTDERPQQVVSRSKFPAVNVSNYTSAAIVPRVVCDDAEIGRLAAEHLVSKGLQSFCICCFPALLERPRCATFVAEIRRQGFPCVHLDYTKKRDRNFFRGVSMPLGLFAFNDYVARNMAMQCRELGLSVPGDVAILGVDNDELQTVLVHPHLSSVDVAADRIGYEAARLVDRLLSGHRPPRKPVLVVPRGVVVRESTDVVAVDNPLLARAMQYVCEHAGAGVTLSEVAQELQSSRRTLQRMYGKRFGGSLKDYIRRLQFDRVQRLLCDTDRTVQDIAESSGFPSYPHFSASFRKRFGKTPGQYRSQFRRR